MKFTPRSTARCNAAIDAPSSVGPYEFPWAFPPIAHAPNPISDTFRPVRPRIRVFIPRANGIDSKNLCRARSDGSSEEPRFVLTARLRVRLMGIFPFPASVYFVNQNVYYIVPLFSDGDESGSGRRGWPRGGLLVREEADSPDAEATRERIPRGSRDGA